MYYDNKIVMGWSEEGYASILPRMANRHGLIAGATGTGKTVTLKVMAESFSKAGVPVFLADVKGDLAGMCQPGVSTEDMQNRIQRFGLSDLGFHYESYPTTFWDIYGKRGLPLRTTISEMGPTLLGRLMDLTPLQTDILTIVFKIADDQELLLIDTKDLRSMLSYVSENNKELSASYGNMSAASLNVIQRAVVALEEAGADQFFGEPALDIHDWFGTDFDGKGKINILDSSSLINDPKLYSTFMLWMLSELFEIMPEAGDPEKPRMVFFFDEAHLLFNDTPKVLLQKIEQVVKLIRSKGIGVYFITQNPKDIPEGVLAQLGNKIQHALRAYTPNEQKAVKAAADSFRTNPEFKTLDAILNLGTGEAVVSFLDEGGIPGVAQIVKILPPESQMGAIPDLTREQNMQADFLYRRYSEYFDRDSAYEFLERKAQADAEAYEQYLLEQQKLKEEEEAKKQAEKEEAARIKQEEKEALAAEKQAERERIAAEKAEQKRIEKEALAAQKQAEKEALAKEKEKQKRANTVKRAAGSVAKTAAGTVGRELGGTLGKTVGGSFGKKLGANVGSSLGRGILGTFFGG